TAMSIHFCDARHGHQLAADVPIMNSAQIDGAVFIAICFNFVLIDFAKARRNRTHFRRTDIRWYLLASRREAFHDQLACEVNVGGIREDNRYIRDAKFGYRTNLFHVRESTHCHFDWKGDLSFDLEWTKRGSTRQNLHL